MKEAVKCTSKDKENKMALHVRNVDMIDTTG